MIILFLIRIRLRSGIVIENNLAYNLKQARKQRGYSQNDVATILHITRQSVSKWERGLVYPDLDNLVRLSEIYQVSLDELVIKGREKTVESEKNQNVSPKTKTSKGSHFFENTNKGIFLLILVIVSSILPPLGMIIPIYVMWQNTKYNSFYKSIYLISVVVVMVSLINSYVVVSDNWLKPSQTTVYRIK